MGELRLIPIERLTLPQDRIRLRPEEGLDELVESVKAVGVVQPIVARPLGRNRFEVVAGERRLRAAKKAGLREIPVVVRSLSDEEADIFKLTENLQRENLTDYEVALWLKRLREQYGLSTTKLASLLGKSQPWIVYLLKMHEAAEVITMVITSSTKYRGLKLEEVMRRLSERQCRALLAAPEKYRIALAEHICFAVNQGLDPPSSVELERMWRKWEELDKMTRLIEETETGRSEVDHKIAEESGEEALPEEAYSPEAVSFDVTKEVEMASEEAEEAGEGEVFDYVVCQLCGAWMPRSSGDPVLPEEMKRHLRDVHVWRPGPGGEYIDSVTWQTWKPDGKSLKELNEELTRGYWFCNFCKGWMPGYDKIVPEPMKWHLREEHEWEPPQPGAWGEALTWSEYMPREGRRIDREPEFIDTGVVFTCPVCGWQATIRHHSDGRHTFQRIRVEEG